MFHGSEQQRQQNASLAGEGSDFEIDDLKGLIAKARWAGLDHHAEKLCHELGALAPEDCVIQGPLETD